MENFKDLLTITPIEYKNIVKVDAKWDYYNSDDPDDDSCMRQNSFNADEFFKDKKLIWSLAYLEKYFAGDSEYIYLNDLSFQIFCHYKLWPFGKDDETCLLEELKIIYYDENGKPSKVTFDNIHKRWETMSEEEICTEVNELIKINGE